jgi:eukaryotic-like serine/threonine-protein kinase
MAERDPLNIVGETVAEKYVIEKAVGEGGFAVVYRAMHNIWNKPVAIKFFSELSNVPIEQRDEMQASFINEGALLTELSSQTAAIVQARDVGSYTTPDGKWMPFMVLEWLEGSSLEEILARETAAGRPTWTLAEVLRLLGPVASALDVAHRRGIAHRDVKPPNIFVLGPDPRAPDVTVKILDFGVAKMITDNTQMKAALAKTGTNITSFTPQYGAPEQFSRSYGATGPWSDVFALALVAVEMLAGRTALDGGDLIQLAYSAGNPQARPTPRALGVQVPELVEAVFQKALAVQPSARFDRAGEFWHALEAAAGGVKLALSETVVAPSSAGVSSAAPAKTELAPPRDITTASPATLGAAMAPAKKSNAALLGGAVIGLLVIAGGVALFAFRSSGKPTDDATGPGVSASAPVVATSAPAPSASAASGKACPKNTFLIPAGQFYMGSDANDAPDNEKPSHNVSLGAFCFDATEVTVEAYAACTQRGACRKLHPDVSYVGMTKQEEQAFKPLCNIDAADRRQHPINCISWRDAETFCRKNGKRLPTEAEWEYATRGPDGRIYPWGDDKPTVQHLNACDADCAKWGKEAGVGVLVLFADKSDGYAATAPVGKFPGGSSRFGPMDVVGNVWEWVADWEGSYKVDDQKNPSGPSEGEKRIIRGGAWNGARTEWLHPAFRFAAEPERRHPAIGFRCAADLPD